MANERWHWQESGTTWKGVGIYHVTLTVPSREPLLGKLVIPEGDPTKAVVERTALGEDLVLKLLSHPKFYPEVRILQFCLMPDHLHAILYVTKPMETSIRNVVRSFWQGAKKLGRAYSLSVGPESDSGTKNKEKYRNGNPESDSGTKNKEGRIEGTANKDEELFHAFSIFTARPFIRSLSRKGQLQAMYRYIRMNPQRLATKRLMPGYFRVQEGIEIAGRTYAGVGNMMLLQAERFAPVHVRRRMVEAAEHGEDKALRDYMNGCVLAARQGTVMVSPFISPKEKEVMDVLLREGHPFIYLADNGFRDYYKPAYALFDAVADGRVLILSPWEYDASKKHISREECVAMNGMAEEICSVA